MDATTGVVCAAVGDGVMRGNGCVVMVVGVVGGFT